MVIIILKPMDLFGTSSEKGMTFVIHRSQTFVLFLNKNPF